MKPGGVPWERRPEDDVLFEVFHEHLWDIIKAVMDVPGSGESGSMAWQRHMALAYATGEACGVFLAWLMGQAGGQVALVAQTVVQERFLAGMSRVLQAALKFFF